MIIKGSVQKNKIAEKETLVHMGGRGVKKSPFFSSPKRGHTPPRKENFES